MRKISFIKVAILILTLGLITNCEKDNKTIDSGITLQSLKLPVDLQRIDLNNVDNLKFEWDKATSNIRTITYEVLFDKADGDLSTPIHVIASANNGTDASVNITKATLDQLAEMTGTEPGNEVTLKWAVRATNGTNSVTSDEQRKITIVRTSTPVIPPGKPELHEGEKLHIGGQGAEAGQQFKNTGNGILEIYTKIEANKPYYFYAKSGETERFFSLTEEGKSFEETVTPVDATLPETAVYRIKVDFSTTSVTYEKIEKVSIRMSMTSRDTKLEYDEKGMWKIENYNIRLTKESWGLEERYKIIFTIDGQDVHWGQAGTQYGERPSISREGYRDIAPTESGQWGGAQFKFPIELCDKSDWARYYTDVVVSMTADKNYTHDFVNYYYYEEKDAKFTNPVFDEFSLPDPDVIRGDDGYFYLIATEHSRSNPDMKNCPVMRSSDLINWERIGSLFTDENHPQITNRNSGIWAPTISKVGNKYAVYYSQPANNDKHAIGVATADHPAGPYVDHGKLIDSDEQGVDISIDAYLYQENGKNYLFWGSFREISVIELTEDGLNLKPGAVRKKVGGGQYEAAYVIKRYGYYYLILSTGNYAKGGTYSLVVGRSRDVMGPYVNKAGQNMNDVKHELMLKGNDTFSSPGHCSRIITDDAGNDWILYHGYPNDKNFRCLFLDRVIWEDEWPIVNTTYPSTNGYVAPVFN